MRLRFYPCLFEICLFVNRITHQIFMKIYGMIGHKPATSRIDSDGNPILDPDPGILKEFYHCDIGINVKVPRHWFGDSPKIRRLPNPILKRLPWRSFALSECLSFVVAYATVLMVKQSFS